MAPPTDWTDDLTACASLVERGDPERFRQVMAAPLSARRALFPLYAFNIEVARAPWVTQEPMIAEMRLQWWRDALEEIQAGTGIRRHDVVTPLSDMLPPAGARWLDALVEARRWDVWKEPFEDATHFNSYLDATSGHLLRAGALMLGEPLDESLAASAGFALGLANWFRAIPALEGSGRQPLPDGRPEAVAQLAQAGIAAADQVRARRTSLPKTLSPLFFGLPEARALLRMAARTPQRVADGALELGPLQARLALTRAAFGRW
ncbi:squalene/phytoene synthase family protein [Pseudooceanicola sp. HF7]|uniref:squalene/phytoene synthase family protein n=1 Tax=Pseudooceanicola sp. HF7 TaxID=2721560 RepID=UPI001430361F|nr:squalene/phytoene synthase family protein [Pseudooceanicola sp. HF7]NIZ10806.1 squalene/phytoene synthase family protein [Pseudooceanicola sp. HF7]